MKDYNYYSIITGEDIFTLIKEALLKKIKDHLSVNPFFTIALSGGNTPRKLYRLLSEEKLPWEKLKIFPVDERILPPDSENLNWKMIKEELLDKLPLSPMTFYPEDLYNDPKKASLELENLLKKEVSAKKDEIPAIDIILLGVGSDGHTASLFPGSEALNEEKKLITITEGPPPFKQRITFTFPLIRSAGERWFLISGKDKREILKKIFKEKNNILPAAKASTAEPSIWFVAHESIPEFD